MKELRGACIIGQSGGPTSVINASAYGVIDTALKSGAITQVLGAEHGIMGVLNDRLFDMGLEDPEELRLLKYTPSSALGSCRYKIADPELDDTDYKRKMCIRDRHQHSENSNKGLNAASRARKLATIRSFFNYICNKRHLLEDNPCKDVDTPKQMKALPRYLTLNELSLIHI